MPVGVCSLLGMVLASLKRRFMWAGRVELANGRDYVPIDIHFVILVGTDWLAQFRLFIYLQPMLRPLRNSPYPLDCNLA